MQTPSSNRRIREYEMSVSRVVAETHDAVTLVFEGCQPFRYSAGQFLTIRPQQFEVIAHLTRVLEQLKGWAEPPRAYSMASAPHEPLAITIQEEAYRPGWTKYPPLLSPVLVGAVTEGTRMVVSGATGAYTLPDDVLSRTDHIVHVTAGSGVVPNWAILKHAVRCLPELRHTFLYSNKSWDDIIFRDALNAFSASHPDRIQLIHTLTRQNVPANAPAGTRHGRVTADLLRQLIPVPTSVLVYACGPALTSYDRAAARKHGIVATPRFLDSVSKAVAEIGVPRDRVRMEAYG